MKIVIQFMQNKKPFKLLSSDICKPLGTIFFKILNIHAILKKIKWNISNTRSYDSIENKLEVLMRSNISIANHECNCRRAFRNTKRKKMKRAKWICPARHVNRTQFYRCATCFYRALIISFSILNKKNKRNETKYTT